MRKVLISFSLAVLASVSSLVAPVYAGLSQRETPVQDTSSPLQSQTPIHSGPFARLAEINGAGTYFVLAIPVALAGLPLLFRSRAIRILSAALIMAWVIVGAASIGLFYLPSAVMMVWAALGTRVETTVPTGQL
jgi:hypothetical protein